jgi:hypothetical protein
LALAAEPLCSVFLPAPEEARDLSP